MNNIGEKVRKRREELGWSQDMFAQKLGYKSRSSINKIENGCNDIPPKKILEFAETLEISPLELLSYYDFPNTIKADYTGRENSAAKDNGTIEVNFSEKDGFSPSDNLPINTDDKNIEINSVKIMHSSDEKMLMVYFDKLNELGKNEALKRIEELTLLEQYNK